MSERPKKIVLTGGPGAGKTVAARHVASRLGMGARFIPEAATQVYHRLGKKWNELNIEQRRAAQTAMYHLQLEQEAHAANVAVQDGVRLLLLDRGTIDGAGYWPDGPELFWNAMGTTQEAELGRYDAVLWLETAAALGLYDNDASNAVRFENAPEAIASGERMAHLWQHHPRVIRVRAYVEFQDKLNEIERVIRSLVQIPVQTA